MRCRAVIVKLQRDADDIIAFALQKTCNDRRIDAARHGDDDAGVFGPSGKIEAVRSRLKDAVGDVGDVRSADYDSALFDEAAKPTTEASTVFSLLSALVGWLFAVCALLVPAGDRRKLAIQQREQGYPPTTTLATLTVDVLVVGLAGTCLGLVGGELLSRGGRMVQVGIRATRFERGHWESTLGVRQFWAAECRARPAEAIDALIAHLREAGVTSVYFSNDIDGTDAAYAFDQEHPDELRVSHPGGTSYERFPVNANEAEARRASRFRTDRHTEGAVDLAAAIVPTPGGDEYPYTVDLRRAPGAGSTGTVR